MPRIDFREVERWFPWPKCWNSSAFKRVRSGASRHVTPVPCMAPNRIAECCRPIWPGIETGTFSIRNDGAKGNDRLFPNLVRFLTVRRLLAVTGVGFNGAWLLVMGLFGRRRFTNRKQLAALVGLTPTPYQSGVSSP